MNTVEAYEAVAQLKINGVKFLDEHGKWMREWNINAPELRVSKVILELVIPGDVNAHTELFISPDEFNGLGLRRHDQLNVSIVVEGEELCKRDDGPAYKLIRFDTHDYIIDVVKNTKLSEARNKAYPKLIKVEKVTKQGAGDSSDDE